MNLKTKMIVAIGAVLLVVLGGAFVFIFNSQMSQSESLYHNQAQAINDSLKLIRKVIAGHGGIFAKQTESFGVNPYLASIPGVPAEIKNAKGEKLALMNGFSFLQEMSQVSKKDGTVAFSYRSPRENPFNPANKPTAEELEILNKMKAGSVKQYSTKVTDKNGKKSYIYSTAMPTEASCMTCHPSFTVGKVDTMMSITLPIDKAEAMKSESLRNIIYIFLGVFVLVLGVIYWLASRITSPIKQLADAADRISMGDSNVVIDIKRKDEIGELADAFNRMAASIKILTMTGEEELPPTGSDS